MVDAAIEHQAHPAPHRHRIGLLVLLATVFAPPLAWSAHLVVNYALSSRACYPDGSPVTAPTLRSLWALLIAIDIISLAISAAGAVIAWRAWRISREEMASSDPVLVETGEGRTRFLAGWGLMIGIGFFVLVAFDFIGLWILPICS